MSTKEELVMKVLVVGAPKVGKTSLLQSDTSTPKLDTYKETIGVDFRLKPIETEHYNIRLQFWDVAGSELVGNMMKTYERDAQAVLYFYSEDPNEREQSLKILDAWVNRISLRRATLITARVGNKSDLAHATQPALPEDPRFDFDIQVSAFKPETLESVFSTLASKLDARHFQSAQERVEEPERGLTSYKKAIKMFMENRDLNVPKFQSFSEIENRVDNARNIDEILEHVKELKTEAAKHRDTGLKYIFKFCWLRKTKSLKELEKIFDDSNHLKKKP
jgi:small GTP-binding protein